MSVPYFTLVVSTRNRPELFLNCLLSIKNQSFENYEVIISDNSDISMQRENQDIVKRVGIKNIHYYPQKNVLPMHESYQFGIEKAKGKYQGVLTDKTFLMQHCLKTCYEILKENPVDILSYNNGGIFYYPDSRLKFKYLVHSGIEKKITAFDPKNEILRRLSFIDSLRAEEYLKNAGKIFFGFYSKNLIQRIREQFSDLFLLASPDYNSCILGLYKADSSLFYHADLCVSVVNFKGTGLSCQSSYKVAIEYLRSASPKNNLEQSFPIPGIPTMHNSVANDYEILTRNNISGFPINMENLIERTWEDISYISEKEAREELTKQLKIFAKKNNFYVREPWAEYDQIKQNRLRSIGKKLNKLSRYTMKEIFQIAKSFLFKRSKHAYKILDR